MQTSDRYDLVIGGGRVLDPALGRDQRLDVGIAEGRVVSVGSGLGPSLQRIDASGNLVLPGLVDVHGHFFHGTGFPQMDPRHDLIPTGLTCAADAGSAGAANFTVFREYLIDDAPLHLYAWLNIEVLGLTAHAYPRVRSLDLAIVEEAVDTIQANRDVIVGVKVLAPSEGPQASDGPELVRRAVEAAAITGTRVLCHIDGGTDLVAVLGLLRAGDIVSHCYQGHEPHLLDQHGRVRPQVWAARERGVLFDMCPGGGYHFAWAVAEAAAAEGFFPDLIGTDYVHLPPPDRPFSITDCMSIMLGLGMPLPQVVEAVTAGPARAMDRGHRHGSLGIGGTADVTVLSLQDEAATYPSTLDGTRTFARRFRSVATIVGGVVQ